MAEGKSKTATEDTVTAASTKALSEATRAADKALREAHQEEWNGYKQAEAKDRGVEWTPRLTEEQKAEKQMADLLAAHPHLASKFADTVDDVTVIS